MRKNEKDLEFVVYEPVKRITEDTYVSKDELKITKQYSGLLNRGNTCYLNSLLQILFMTKEFRENILSWKYLSEIHGKREDSIPFQLQKIFARMQLRLRDSECTEDLTKSFDWGHQQLMEQHDIQELCRVMFEAIEMSLSNNDNFINNLFQGFSTSVVKCLSCHKESNKSDRFLDISLPVRDQFEKIYNTSLEMALMNFLKKEKLCGDNQYNCDNCGFKSDALKYLKFTKLPKILFLQLNRFEYDYMTDGRKKICDRVTFPSILNMNQFLKDYDDIKKFLTNSILNELEKRENFNFDKNDQINDQEKINFKKSVVDTYFAEGDNVYELFSVVVHSGCARGGHYYSFIKSFEDDKWYRFDDCHVYEADIKNIEYTFGESGRNGLNAVTGYILMYRQIEKLTKNETYENNSNSYCKSIDNDLIFQNSELMKIIEEQNMQILIEEEKQKEKLNSLQLKFFYNDKIINILAKKNQKIFELKSRVLKEFELLQVIPQNARLRCVHNQTYKLLDAYSLAEEHKTLEEVNPPILQHKTYGIEIKSDCEEFEEYNPNLIVMNIIKWDDKFISLEEKDLKFEKIKIDKKKILKDLRSEILKFFKLGSAFDDKQNTQPDFSQNLESHNEIFLLKKVDYASNNFQLTEIKFSEEDLEKELASPPLLLSDNSKLFLEIKNQNWTESKFIKFFDDNSAGVIVKFNMPLKKEIQEPNQSSLPSSQKKRITLNSYRFDYQLEIKKSRSLNDLKKRIGEVLKISENEFIMKKNSHNGPELKCLNDSIDKYTANILTVYIELGSPQKDSEIKINLYTCEYDFSFFLVFPYKVVDAGYFIVDLNWNIKRLKQFLIAELEKKQISGQNINFKLEKINIDSILIRDYKNDRPAKIYFEDDNLMLGRDLQFNENKKIVIQKYNNVLQQFAQTDIQCSIREWDPANWKISQPVEFHIHKGMTFLEFASKILEYFPHLIPDKISAFKIQNEMNVFMDDFIKYKFENLYEKSDFVLDHYPFFVNTDGSMIIIKDDNKIYREPTIEEIRIYCRPKSIITSKSRKSISSTSSINSTSSCSSRISKSSLTGGFKPAREKEKGLVIKVKTVQSNSINENGIYLPTNYTSSISCSENLKSKIDEENSFLNFNKNLNINKISIDNKDEIEIFSKEIKELPGEENKESGYLNKNEDSKMDV